jgi:hypothetical protein
MGQHKVLASYETDADGGVQSKMYLKGTGSTDVRPVTGSCELHNKFPLPSDGGKFEEYYLMG